MKTLMAIWWLGVFCTFPGKAQQQLPYLNWSRTYGGSEYDIPRKITYTKDGGYLLGGTSNSSNGDKHSLSHGKFDIWLVKINPIGELIWEKSYGGSSSEYIRDIIPLADGFLIGGYTSSDDGDVQSGNNGLEDFWVFKIDNTGNLIWERTYGGSNEDLLKSIQSTAEGGFLLAGSTKSYNGDVHSGNTGSDDFWIVKIDSLGNIDWEKTYGGANSEVLDSQLATKDGGYLLGGYKFFYPQGGDAHSDFWVVKINSKGQEMWTHRYGGSRNESLKQIIAAKDGGYLLGGITSSNDGDVVSGNHGFYPTLDFWLVKIDANGNIEWENTFGGGAYESLWSIAQASDDGYILGGTTNSDNGDIQSGNHGYFDFWIVRVSDKGELIWEQTYGGSHNDVIRVVFPLTNGNYLFGGSTLSDDNDVQSGNKGANDFWLVSINDNNVPVFKNQTVSVRSTSRLGPSNAVIKATDDEYDSMAFTILAGNDARNFLIENNGRLSVLKNLYQQDFTSYNLSVEVTDGKHTTQANVTVNIDGVLGLDNNHLLLEVYPNPIVKRKGYITNYTNKNLKFDVLNPQGMKVMKSGELLFGINEVEWPLMNPGIYLLNIYDQHRLITSKKLLIK